MTVSELMNFSNSKLCPGEVMLIQEWDDAYSYNKENQTRNKVDTPFSDRKEFDSFIKKSCKKGLKQLSYFCFVVKGYKVFVSNLDKLIYIKRYL